MNFIKTAKTHDGGRNPATLPLDAVMTADPEVLPVTGTVAHALNKMSLGGFRHVPVVDEDHHPVFVVSVRDIVEFLVEAFPREVLTLSHDAAAQVPRARDGA
jgi:CBS domain-containing protein